MSQYQYTVDTANSEVRLDLWICSDDVLPERGRELILAGTDPDDVRYFVRAANPSDVYNYGTTPDDTIYFRCGEISKKFQKVSDVYEFLSGFDQDLAQCDELWSGLNAAEESGETVSVFGRSLHISVKTFDDFYLASLYAEPASGSSDSGVFLLLDDADDFGGVCTYSEYTELESGDRCSGFDCCFPSQAKYEAFVECLSEDLVELYKACSAMDGVEPE